jgi:uncharacterized membrane protein
MNPLLPFHILAGSVALIAGAVAMSARKGGPLHAKAGTAFFLSMLALAGTGAIIALLMPERGTATIGILTCYLVATSWMTARKRSGEAGRFEFGAMLVAFACAASFLAIALIGLAEPDGRLDRLPAPFHFPFLALALLAAALDLNFIARRRLSNPQRVARHLWRMGTTFLIAAFSFFLGQQDNMPEFVRGSPLLFVPPFAVLATMLFWIFRVRLGRRFGRWPSRASQPVPTRLAQENA